MALCVGVPVSWQSKVQKYVTLSSSEAECVALSEDVKSYVCDSVVGNDDSVMLQVMVRVDNVGANLWLVIL